MTKAEIVKEANAEGLKQRRGRRTSSAGATSQKRAPSTGAERVVAGDASTMPSKEHVPDLQTIKKALPAHVFKASLPMSLYYVARSIALIVGFAAALAWAQQQPWYAASVAARVAVVGFYWLMQGTVMWGIFTLGHDCGHGSFSRYAAVNWFFGNLLHTFILTPYESWRITHRHHHKNTGHMDNDEIFYPQREGQAKMRLRYAVGSLFPAWFAYLLCGYSPRNTYHFLPWDPLFQKYKSEVRVAMSVTTYVAFVYCLYLAAQQWGWATVGLYYGAPVAVFASWLVVTTFLHHNEPGVEWYADETWDYVKGNLSSVDRSYWPFDNLIHDIGTHQIHHLYPIIPHYKLVEATAAFREAFPALVNKSDQHFVPAFLRALKMYVSAPPVPVDAQYFRYKADDEE